MHDPQTDQDTSAQVATLLASEGWSLIVRLFADAEYAQVLQLRQAPLGPEAEAASVKMAHIEELRDMFRSVTPQHFGDPFDARPSNSGHGSEPEPERELEYEEDDYDLG